MKKLLVFAVFCCMAFVSKAAVINTIINSTTCPVTVTQVCYMPPMCTQVNAWTVVVAPGTAMPMPAPGCPPPQETAYTVCWAAGCPGLCTMVTGQGAPATCFGFPVVAPLPPCPSCSPAAPNVTYDPVNNNVIIK